MLLKVTRKMILFFICVLAAGTASASVVQDSPLVRDITTCTGGIADVILLLDRSGSVGNSDYEYLVDFALYIARTVGISENGVRIGVASYATTARREVNLDTYNITKFEEGLNSLVRDTILTNIADGLLVSEAMLNDAATGAREDVIKLIVVTNDGLHNRGDPPIPVAEELHRKNISIISIGITSDVSATPSTNPLYTTNDEETKGLASKPEYYHYVAEYTILNTTNFLENATGSVCTVVTQNAPKVYSLSSYIKEDKTIGTLVGTIDPAIIESVVLVQPVFTLITVESLPFSVNSASGEIRTVALLDFEVRRQYVFVVRVTDPNIPLFSEDIKITINVQDVNDNIPIPASLLYRKIIAENIAFSPPTVILTISASDSDSGLHAQLYYSITRGNEAGKFFLDSSSGQLSVVGVLDRESEDVYTIYAVATDLNGAVGGQVSAEIKMIITITDINDYPPTFEQTVLYLEYFENQALGFLYQIIALDQDLGENGRVSYTIIEGNQDSVFSLETATGNLNLVSAFDFESINKYTLVIKAEDNGASKLSSQVTVDITIKDIDEPLSIDGPYSKIIPENTIQGFEIVKVTATDPDKKPIQYSIVEANLPFSINGNGLVTLSGQIDREGAVYVYTVTIRASAGSTSIETILTVTVTDINDNTPSFSQSAYSGSISEGALLDDLIVLQTPIVAVDNDATSPNKDINFAIVIGNTNNAFKIDQKTGILSVNNPSAIDFESSTSFVIYISATDAGIPQPLFSISSIFVTVMNVNDNSPVFTKSSYTAEVAENLAVNSFILKVSANDADNEPLTYSIADGVPFKIDSLTGSVSLSSLLDVEIQSIYNFQVAVTDGKYTENANIKVSITDVNDVKPAFKVNEPLALTLSETKPIGYRIYTFEAMDGDLTEPNNQYMITIESGNTDNVFAIDEISGNLTIASKPTPGTYNLIIKVEDKGIIPGSLFSTAIATITVTLDNKNAPVFIGGPYSASVDENIANANVLTVSANDVDGTADLIYSITGPAGHPFTIDYQSGQISGTIAFDSETVFTYMINIRVTDKGDLFDETTVTVNINDDNDNAPEFVSGPNSFPNLKECVPVGTVLAVYQATDKDRTSPSNLVRYSIADGSGKEYFSINETTGELQIAKALDFETTTEFSLRIIATDQGSPSLSSHKDIEVGLLNCNEYPPVFTVVKYEKNVLETRPVGYLVLTVSATDADADSSITYSISSALPFQINGNELTIKTLLDFEVKNQYDFFVTATDNGNLQSTAQVIINVIDVNDNAPVFGNLNIQENVPEDSQLNTIVATVSANDVDSGNNGMVEYSIIGGNTGSTFSIDQSGNIKLIKTLNFETIKKYTLKIRASDKGDPSLSTTSTTHATVVIDVTDVNEKPAFTSSFSFNIDELVAINTNIITVSAQDEDEGTNGMLLYSIVSGNQDDKFKLDEITGNFALKNSLNFEVEQSYFIIIRATDKGNPALDTSGKDLNITFTVMDQNERPVFEPNTYSKVISETTTVGTEVVTVTATDEDNGNAGVVMYSIVNGNVNDVFAIDMNNGLLTVAKPLNFGDQSIYILTVRATDKGDPSRFTEVLVTVTIIDENDNAPIFNPESYTKTLSETTSTGSPVEKVIATDLDSGSNGIIVFSILAGNEKGLFAIDETSGVVQLIKGLDFEDTQMFTLIIEASDKGSQPQKSNPNAILKIIVTDVNEHSPKIIDLPETITVSEDKSVGFQVVIVNATDEDTADKVTITITTTGPFTIDENGLIIVSGDLDRETEDTYVITVTATDGTFTDSQIITVSIGDSNDQKPIFSVTSQTIDVAENEPIGFQCATVTATDNDLGDNGKVTYEIISGNDDGVFVIDENTGIITLDKKLDHENVTSYTLIVRATDQGETPLDTSGNDATVIVNVIDVNDNEPEFNDLIIEVSVPENKDLQSLISTVSATDEDSGVNGVVRYSIVGGNQDNRFYIDQNTGEVKLLNKLNFEATTNYTLIIQASDNGIPPMSTSGATDATLVIYVTDINEKPVFRNIYFVEIDETVAVDTELTTVSAEDEDEGTNGMLLYSIVSGNGDDKFRLNEVTAVLELKNSLNFEKEQSYFIIIRATDKGNPALDTSGKDSNITITVNDKNERPVFNPDTYSETISETIPVGSEVVTVTATDEDDGNAGVVMYSIGNGNVNDVFSIHMNTGTITVAKALNFEVRSGYVFVVRATDKGDPSRFSEVLVNITVTDVNNNAPIFNPVTYTKTLSEATSVGSQIEVVTATDKDFGSNGMIEFSIIGGNEKGIFEIDQNGIITLIKSLDFETMKEFTLLIEAADKGVPQLKSSPNAEVKIAVTDVNENLPKITNLPTLIIVEENIATGSEIFSVTAVDEDTADVITFSISVVGPFSIDENGVITTTGELDRETVAIYTIRVIASDGTFTDEKILTVTIGDVNDKKPVFTLKTQTVNIAENEPIGFECATVEATDEDLGTNGMVTYTIVSGNDDGVFVIDQISGVITLNTTLDFEITTTYSIIVRATDKGETPLDTTGNDALVIINVTDVNDNKPEFEELPEVFVPENEELQSIVATVVATDKDSGTNGMVMYSIIGGNGDNRFYIDVNTGDVKLLNKLNFESTTNYTLIIRATDKGIPPMSTSGVTDATLAIYVTDINEKPVFRNIIVVEIDETVAVDTELTTVSADDEDEGTNGMLLYSIVSGNEDDKFRLDETTGVVELKNSLNFEVKQSYVIIIRATDKGNPALDTSGKDLNITITVNDKNERPVFNPDTYSETISEATPVGTEVVTVTATDEDNGDAGVVMYSISNGNVNEVFAIDMNNGKITIAKPLDFEVQRSHVFVVRATDKGDPSRFTEVLVTITLTDDNDNAPIFNPVNYTRTISEGIPIGSPVATVIATDKDSGSNGMIEYTFVAGNEKGVFEMNLITGAIKVVKSLNFEDMPMFTLIIKATDKGDQPRSSNPDAILKLLVVDVNEHTPVITNLPTTRAIPEGSVIGINVIQVIATDQDTNDVLKFTIAPGVPFSIDETTGVITTTEVFDRESRDAYTIQVVVSDGQFTDSETLTVTISDVNDNKPVFTTKTQTVVVSEKEPIGFECATVVATDGDIGLNAMIIFSIVSGNDDNVFTIDTVTGKLTLNKMLDFETVTNYSLVVRATDKGANPLDTSGDDAVIEIIVEDFNDNKPEFEQVTPVTLPENEQPKVITTVKAVDEDSGVNGNVMYAIESGNEDGKFLIDMITGEVSLVGSLDYESVRLYELVIIASDKGQPSLSSRITLVISITDVNDNSPVFKPDSVTKTIPENVKVGETIVTVTATDEDSGDNGNVMYTIVSGNEEGLVVINMTTGEITVAGEIDREVIETIVLVVKATDKGEPSSSSTVTVTINISDENDNKPIFKTDYEETVPENLPVGEEIVTVSAEDADIGDNGKIRYRIASGNNDATFSIGIMSGIIKLEKQLDFESIQKYTLLIEGTDEGSPAQTSQPSATVIIHVTDINDNAPVYLPVEYSVEVLESSAIGIVVERVTATDKDSGLNGMIFHEILSGNTEDVFEINENGVITLKQNVDFETKSLYVLIIKATDKGSPSKSSIINAKVTVTITNTNDHSPEFINEPYQTTINENVADASSVLTVEATDLDNEKLTYKIITGNVPFTINPDSGLIQTSGVVDRESVSEYMILVEVSDGGKTDQSIVKITIGDENDNTPVVADIEATFPEDQSVNTNLITIVGTDIDEGDNADLMYQIESGNDNEQFELNMNTGSVTLKKPFDFESVTEYVLIIRTSDKGTPSLSTTSIVKILVTDVNDNDPECVDITVTVREDIKVSSDIVATVVATDEDSGSNGQVIYSITGGNGDGKFKIDENSGRITAVNPLDFETQPQYKLTITVRDNGNPSRSSTCIYTINVSDVNDNNPIFKPLTYKTTISETAPLNEVVITVTANDADSTKNGMVTYEIVSGNLDANEDGKVDFAINRDTGAISPVSKLDAKVPVYTLEVSATDKGDSPRTSETNALVTITIINVNVAPAFTNTPFDVSVSESTEPQTVIKTITAEDNDGDNIVFEIATVGVPFEINPSTGEIKTTTVLDRETTSSYTLVVTITDGDATIGNTFTITVIDDNDNAPAFSEIIYQVSVPEDKNINQGILTVEATDADQGSNAAIMFQILSGNDDDKFELDMTTGRLILINSLDFEVKQSYRLTVTASDKGDMPMSTQVIVEVNVTDVNDNTPVFNPREYTVTFAEDVSIGSEVETVTATDADSGTNGEILYRIVSGNENNVFVIDELTGQITFNKLVDYESQPSYVLRVKATDKGTPSRNSIIDATVTVTITDVNDNKPIFNPALYEQSVSEGREIGFAILSVIATDADSNANGMIMYSITEGNEENKFELDMDNGGLSLKNKLNFEATTLYTLVITATDKGFPQSLTSMPLATVIITVTNENDNSPEFIDTPNKVNIDENVNEGTLVVKVSATDSDDDNLTYSITTPSVPFTINSTTGEIKTSGLINRENVDKYSITVVVSDGKNTATMIIEITVDDQNDNSPVVPNQEISVYEDSAVQIVIATVSGTDADIGSNAVLMHEIIGGNENGKFTIDMTSGDILVVATLDFEVVRMYTLTIRTTDKGTPTLSTTSTVKVNVNDVNDNDPESTDVEVSIPEDKAPNSEVVQVTGTDADSTSNGMLTYTIIAGNADGKFSINNENGMILTTSEPLDFESVEQYTLTVTVSDKGTPSRSTSIAVTINIENINDNSPVFVPDTFAAKTIPETTTVSTIVVRVNAIDADKGSFGMLEYSIVSGNGDATGDGIPDFEVDVNGNIKVLSGLSSTDIPMYVLELTATDKGNLGSISNVRITIFVTNVNAPPTFTNEPFQKEIPEDISPNSFVIKITATDPDNTPLLFALVTNGVPFKVNATTGIIETTQALDRETISEYILTISVTDSQATIETTVKVIVTDVNDLAPVFTEDCYKVSLPENKLSNQAVKTIEATDGDQGDNGKVFYQIKDGNDDGNFELNSQSGQLRLVKPLDFETTSYFKLTVTATDKGSPALSSEGCIKINITDVNDNSPIFEPSTYNKMIREDASVKTVITSVTATDGDSEQNGMIVYEIVSGNAEDKFQINGNVITLKRTLDFEQTTAYVLTIRAKDRGTPSLTSDPNAIVRIGVIDVNDNAPVFKLPSYTLNIPETTSIGSVVETIDATDNDSGSNGMIMYTIKSGNGNNDFKIKMETGELSVNGALDAIQTPMYNLIVSGTDKGNPTKSTDVAVKITITDVNMPPVLSPRDPIDIMDNLAIDEVVISMTANDPDTGTNGMIMYEITNGNDGNMFKINMNSGKVQVAAALTTGQFSLTIKVSDKGSPSLSDSKIFIINVIPSNHQPSITPQSPLKISEIAEIGTQVTKVVASDSDEGKNGEIMFSITGGNGQSGNVFTIDMDGIIRTNEKLNASITKIFNLQVTVTDKGNPPLSTSATIVINVIPMSKPKFTNGPYKSCVIENSAVGQLVLTVSAQDDENDKLDFSLSPQSVPFSIDSMTGQIRTTAVFDREAQDSYSFVVVVSDGIFKVQADVSVCVKDENDVKPTIVKPDVGVICENAEQGKIVLTIVANDPDLNTVFQYRLSSNDNNLPFTIDQHGNIKLSGSIDFETKRFYMLTVFVSDGVQESSMKIRISICNINEHNPIFNPVTYNKTIPSTLPQQSVVTVVTATDEDKGKPGIVRYSIISGNDQRFFRINARDGSIVLRKNFNIKNTTTFKLTVRATDLGVPPRTSNPNAQVLITVTVPEALCQCKIETSRYRVYYGVYYIRYRIRTGSTYLEKVKIAIDQITTKIQELENLKVKFNRCNRKIKAELMTSPRNHPIDTLLGSSCQCKRKNEIACYYLKKLISNKEKLVAHYKQLTDTNRCNCYCRCRCTMSYYTSYYGGSCGCPRADYSGCRCPRC